MSNIVCILVSSTKRKGLNDMSNFIEMVQRSVEQGFLSQDEATTLIAKHEKADVADEQKKTKHIEWTKPVGFVGRYPGN